MEEKLFKVVVVGDIGVGKTAFIKKHVHGLFSDEYRSTIGVDFALKQYILENKILCRVQLWDIAGQERFGNMTRVYYRESHAVIIVFDLSKTKSFDAIRKWKNDVNSKLDPKLPCLLLGNKSDLIRMVTIEEINKLLQEPSYQHVKYYPISVKKSDKEYIDNIMIEFITNVLAENRHINIPLDNDNDDEIIHLDNEKYTEININHQNCCE